MPAVTLTAIGGPTALIELGGLRIVTDPTFDPPGEQPRGLVKTAGPALPVAEIGRVDVVLLSHDQHPDNLDAGGRDLLARAARVLTTTEGAARLGGGAEGVAPWTSVALERRDAPPITVTAVPARHGPEGCEPVMGEVIGFVLTGGGIPSVYVSGDNESLEVVREIADRLGPIELAVLFAGGASIPQRFDGAYLTLASDGAAEAARILQSRAVLPLHYDGWAHFSEGADELLRAFTVAGLAERLVLAAPGETVTV
jgi:L-ascorbate metabolism protein UlaG (beta-lactamase superfamily)